MFLKEKQRKETREIEQKGKCMCAGEREKKGDLMQLDLVLQVLQCSDKTFMSQKGWIPKLSWKEAFQANKKPWRVILCSFYKFRFGAGNKRLKRDWVAPFITTDNSAFVNELHELHQGGSVLLLLYRQVKGRPALKAAVQLTCSDGGGSQMKGT